MDTSNTLPKSARLLDDLESIRQLLGDDTLQPPLLTDTVTAMGPADPPREPVPLLSEPVGQAARPTDLSPAPKAAAASTPAQNRQDTLLHLDSELRAAAQLIMQDVIDDFAPHIETEIRRRLEARMERLLNQQ